MRLVHADAIVTGDASAIVDAAVAIHEDGVIAEVGPAATVLPRHATTPVERIAGVVMPGLVNAHTHVELSALAGRVRGGRGFFPWVDEMLGVRGELDEEETNAAIAAAVASLEKAGTVAVGDVTNTLAAVRPLTAVGMAGCVFHEVFGIVRASVLARLAGLAQDFEARLGIWPSPEMTYAPSPHTLYTTHPDAVRALLEMARSRPARASVHLLEHAAEREALEKGEGNASAWLMQRVPGTGEIVWPKQPVLDYASSLGALASDVLLVHLTEARPAELERIAKAKAPVVTCPRSNVAIEGRMPPIAAMLAAGLEPAIGTDSLASSPSLDVLAEARFALDREAAPAPSLLRMATWNGARALGRKDLGRIAKGTRPGLVAIEVPLGDNEPCAHVLRNVAAPRRFVARRSPQLHVTYTEARS